MSRRKYIILVYIQIEHQYGDMHESQSIVIDNGSGMLKSGFAEQDFSCALFSSIIAYLSYSSQMIGV